MIKIPEKIWYAINTHHYLDEGLAYACPYVEKNGKPDKSTLNMQETGRNWARSRATTGPEDIIENKPTKGFYIGSSVSRWSTSNKLFRVKDPRGFTIEVPTGNIATLLHHSTVINGVVQDECVWGREGSNHILLPVNSEPYLETREKEQQLTKLIKIRDLKIGDVVKLFEDDKEYQYLGNYKITFEVKPWSFKADRWGSTRQKQKEYVGGVHVIEYGKTVSIFATNYNGSPRITDLSNPKIVEVIGNEKDRVTVDSEKLSKLYPYRPPTPVAKKVVAKVGNHVHSSDTKVVAFRCVNR